MRVSFILLITLIFGACSGGGEQQPGTSFNNQKNATPAAFDFVEEIHNFGELTAGEKVIYSFPFTNTGGSDIKIEKAESECVCLEISFDQKAIKPGEKGLLRVVYDTSGLFGTQFQMFRISANNGTLTKELAVTADVRNENIIYQ